MCVCAHMPVASHLSYPRLVLACDDNTTSFELNVVDIKILNLKICQNLLETT